MSIRSLATSSVAVLCMGGPLAAIADKPTPVEVVNADPIPVSVVTNSVHPTHMGVPVTDHVTAVLGFTNSNCPEDYAVALVQKPDGGSGGVLVVPAGKAFVLTDVTVGIVANSGYAVSEGQLWSVHITSVKLDTFSVIAWQKSIPVDGTTVLGRQTWFSASLTGGAVIGPGRTVCAAAGLNGGAPSPLVYINNFSKIYGYFVDYPATP